VARDDHSTIKTAEIKRLVASGRYRIDPVAVADALVRRGNRILWGHQRPAVIVHLPRRRGDWPS
jgi:hypothetical protein